MVECAGIKANGERCRGIAATGSDYCPAHHPDRREARSRAASKAAKSKSNRELVTLKNQLQSIADRTLTGDIDTRRATAATQALQAKIRAIEVERRVREEDELFERLAELERRARERWAG